MDAGGPITVLSGVHAGCFELFAQREYPRHSDLKGKSVGVQALGSNPHLYLTGMAAYVGLDPVNDINWVTSDITPMPLFAEGKIDAFLGVPPEPQELRERNIGHVVVNSASIGRGRSTFAALWPAAPTMFRATNRDQARLARFSRRADLCVSDPQRSRGSWSMTASPPTMTMPCGRSLTCLTTGGGNTIRRTRFGFIALALARGRHDQVEPADRSSPTARTGASSTS